MTPLIYRLLVANAILPEVFGAPLEAQKVVNVVEESTAHTSSSLAKSYGLPIQAVPYFVCIPTQLVSSSLLNF
jgi:hypothetical protein